MTDEGHRGWAREEFGRAMLGDVRNLERVVAMAAQVAERPHPTVPQVFPAKHEADAAYAFLNNADVDAADLLTARHEACARRCDGVPLVIAPEDGSSWRFTDQQKTKGTGPIGAHKQGARGVKVMTIYTLLPDGTPLGVLAEEVWARPETASSEPNGKRPLEEKESRWWTVLQQRASDTLRMACERRPRLWYQLDREADQVPVLLRAASNLDDYLTVRVEDNRCLAAHTLIGHGKHRAKLEDALAIAQPSGVLQLRVRGAGARRRVLSFELSVVNVTLYLSALWSKKHVGDVNITVVIAREVGSASGDDGKPLEWLLYTTYPVNTFEDAARVVQMYALRWRIERHHFTTKTGACELPKSQLRSFNARRKWIMLHTSVSARLQHVLHRARSEPDVAALEEFAAEEIEATHALLVGRHMASSLGSVESAKLGEVVESIARLGGYQGPTRSGGPPGIQTFQRGFEQVEAARAAFDGQRELLKRAGARHPPEA